MVGFIQLMSKPYPHYQSLPKTDLHVHLDGSMRVSTLIDLAQAEGLSLPAYTEAELNQILFKDRYSDLVDYLKGFAYVTQVLHLPENLERVSYEFAWDNFNEGVTYFEVRFAPQLHIGPKQTMERVLRSVAQGLKRAQTEFNNRPQDQPGPRLQVHFGIIVCAMRAFSKEGSPYYRSLLERQQDCHLKDVYSTASEELIQDCIEIRDRVGIPLVGLDLAGPEAGYPSSTHRKAMQFAHQQKMKVTIHAGEAYGPESVHQAVRDLEADRVGHGFHLFSEAEIRDPRITDKALYVQKLVSDLKARGTTIEVCLTSNLQTLPHLEGLAEHTFKRMLDEGINVTLCTDNRTVSKTQVTREIELAVQHFSLTANELFKILLQGFKASFFPGADYDKATYIASVEKELKKALLVKSGETPS